MKSIDANLRRMNGFHHPYPLRSYTASPHLPTGSRLHPLNLLLSFSALFLLLGCTTSTIESRKQERLTAYRNLSPEMQQVVDRGQLRVGMSQDAVYIAWGAPDQVLQAEDAQGPTTTWLYHGHWMDKTRHWAYREVSWYGERFLERRRISDYESRDYVRAEITFENGRVTRWRTLPRPVDASY